MGINSSLWCYLSNQSCLNIDSHPKPFNTFKLINYQRRGFQYSTSVLCTLSPHRECCRFFGDDGLTPKVLLTRVAPFGLLWILTNYLYLQALRKINTTDASALFCCNKAFVFLLSWIVLRDRFMGVRVRPRVCLCVCFSC